MILLEYHSRVLAETIRTRILSKNKTYSKISLCDFDGCQYLVQSADSQAKNLVQVSISWPCYNDLKQFGVENRLKAEYGPHVIPPVSGYDFSLQFDADAVPDPDTFPEKIALIKRHVFAAPLNSIFEALDGKGGNVPDIVTIPYRKSEALYLKKTDGNRVVMIFSINFQDKDDIIYSDVFLKEFADTRKQISSAPPVMFSRRDPPLELKGVRGLQQGEDQGYVSFVIASGAAGSERRTKTIDNIILFRNYLMYHIKCAKAYLHTRMRVKTAAWLQVINRAKMKEPDEQKEKKTITGRTFERS